MTFRIGQKVVCVKSERNPLTMVKVTYPAVGDIYIVRSVGMCCVGRVEQPGVRLEEILNAPYETMFGFREPFFSACDFRPIVERKTDISFAHEILRKASKPAKVPVVVTSAHHRQQGE